MYISNPCYPLCSFKCNKLRATFGTLCGVVVCVWLQPRCGYVLQLVEVLLHTFVPCGPARKCISMPDTKRSLTSADCRVQSWSGAVSFSSVSLCSTRQLMHSLYIEGKSHHSHGIQMSCKISNAYKFKIAIQCKICYVTTKKSFCY